MRWTVRTWASGWAELMGNSACVDDEYLMSDSQSKLQGMLDIAQYYGEMYGVTYGASKTKVTVVG